MQKFTLLTFIINTGCHIAISWRPSQSSVTSTVRAQRCQVCDKSKYHQPPFKKTPTRVHSFQMIRAGPIGASEIAMSTNISSTSARSAAWRECLVTWQIFHHHSFSNSRSSSADLSSSFIALLRLTLDDLND